MGFRAGGYMTVWEVKPGKSENYKVIRMSSQRKNKMTGDYEQDFSGFVSFVGEANLLASKLHEKSRIRIEECEVTTSYNKELRKEFVNYTVYKFEIVPSKFDSEGTYSSSDGSKNEPSVNDILDDDDDEDLPF